jgi:hypothetical protein
MGLQNAKHSVPAFEDVIVLKLHRIIKCVLCNVGFFIDRGAQRKVNASLEKVYQER